MGGCDSNETISIKFPLDKIQRAEAVGGNVALQWESVGGILFGNDKEKSECKKREHPPEKELEQGSGKRTCPDGDTS